jgi:hypothetical protein
VKNGTNPLDGDSDGDGLTDGYEFDRGLNPLSGDSDADGISDAIDTLHNFLPTIDGIPRWTIKGFDLSRAQYTDRDGQIVYGQCNVDGQKYTWPEFISGRLFAGWWPFKFSKLSCEITDNAGEVGLVNKTILVIQPIFAAFVSALTATLAFFGLSWTSAGLIGENVLSRG